MATQKRQFKSKVDTWYVVLMAAVVVLSGSVAIPAVLARRWWMVMVLAAPAALLVWNWLSTSYVVSSEALAVRCLLLRKSIPLQSIRTLRASRDMRSSPALSLDRIEVLADGDSVLVSPEDQVGFIRATRIAQPSVAVEGLPDTT